MVARMGKVHNAVTEKINLTTEMHINNMVNFTQQKIIKIVITCIGDIRIYNIKYLLFVKKMSSHYG